MHINININTEAAAESGASPSGAGVPPFLSVQKEPKFSMVALCG